MFLLTDECCPKGLSAVAEGLSHAVQRTVETPALGKGASDADIFAFAAANDAVLVTINQADFMKLADLSSLPCGMILLPALRGSDLAKLFRTGLADVSKIFEMSPTAIVRMSADGAVQIVRP